MSGQPADELCARYEALRAAATGQAVCNTPRGLALLLSQGLPAWMGASAPLAPPAPVPLTVPPPTAAGVGAEVVRVLTEMALGSRPRLVVS